MKKKFIFIKDIERFLEQGKTQIKLPEGTRLSPAAWDLVRENNIKMSFTSEVPQADVEIQDEKRQEKPSNKEDVKGHPTLVAIVSAEREISGTVAEDAGHSNYLLIFDHDGKFIDIIKNPYSDGGKDADLLLANLLASSQVSVIAAQKFYPDIRKRLEAKNIQYFETSGPILDAVKTIFNKTL